MSTPCDKCGAPATVYITDVVANRPEAAKQRSLCRQCAEHEGAVGNVEVDKMSAIKSFGESLGPVFSMIPQLTDRARMIFAMANQMAVSHGSVITPACILAGLIKEGTGTGVGILKQLGVDAEALNYSVISQLDSSSSGETKSLILKADAEAKRLGHGCVGSEHLLLALTQSDDDVVSTILLEYGVSASKVEALITAGE